MRNRSFNRGLFAQDMANTKGFTREQMDDFAISSLKKRKLRLREGYFKEEIVPVEVKPVKVLKLLIKMSNH